VRYIDAHASAFVALNSTNSSILNLCQFSAHILYYTRRQHHKQYDYGKDVSTGFGKKHGSIPTPSPRFSTLFSLHKSVFLSDQKCKTLAGSV